MSTEKSPSQEVSFDIKKLPKSSELIDFLNGEAKKNAPLKKLVKFCEKGEITIDDETVMVESHATNLTELALLYYLARTQTADMTLETGFNYGLASAAILLAHQANHTGSGHVPVADNIREIEYGIGVKLLEHFELENYQLMEHPPFVVLPQIYANGIGGNLGIAYLNGRHEFTQSLIELFYTLHMTAETCVIIYRIGPNRQGARAQALHAFKAQFEAHIDIQDLGEHDEAFGNLVAITKKSTGAKPSKTIN